MNRNVNIDIKGDDFIWMLFWLCVLGAVVALMIGLTTRSIHREQARADSCYMQYAWNQQTQQSYLAVDYCGGQRDEETDR